MKIDGPDGPGGAGPISPQQIQDGEAVGEATFEEVLDQQTEQVDPGAPAAHNEVSARISAGEITGSRAAELLIEATTRKMGKLLEPALRERIRVELRRLLKEDPVLSRKVKSLTGG